MNGIYMYFCKQTPFKLGTIETLKYDQTSKFQAYQNSMQLPTLTLSQTTNFRLLQAERVCRQQFQIC